MAKTKGIYTRQYGETVSYGIDYIHPGTGQRIRKILKGVKSETEAFKLRTLELADAHRQVTNTAYGLKDRVRQVLFSDMIDEYLKWSKENKDSWKTDYFRSGILRKFFQGKIMPDITPFMVERYKMMRIKSVERSTVNKDLILGNQIYKKAIQWQKYTGGNPFEEAGKFELKKPKKPGYLSPEEVKAIRDQIKHSVKRDMIDFAFNTGWRISEIRHLKWEHVNLGAGVALIADPKNNTPAEIVLNDEASMIIERQARGTEFVFCFKNGNPFKTNLHKVIKNAAKRAGVELPPRKAWHIFRRTWASMMLQSGCDIETLRELGNWKDYSMPMWYANAGNQKHKKKMLNRLPKLDNGIEMAPKAKVVNINN